MKNIHVRLSTFFASSVSLLLIVFSLITATSGQNSYAGIDLQPEYNAAVNNAKAMTADKISKNLTAIVNENDRLQWENDMPGTRVLMATWLGNQSACQNYMNLANSGCKTGSECVNYRYNSWVTVVPEMKNLLGKNPSLLRVSQALGLPPPASNQNLDNTCVIELYVSPRDLFRPSADPEITDHQAELDFPMDGFRKYDDALLVYSEMPCDNAHCPNCTSSGKCGMTSYRNWFDNRRAYIYSQTTVNSPYPWTGLGYTYDWGNPVFPHIGLSEFVVNSGTDGIPVFIKSVTWTRDYFAKKQK